MLKFFFLKNDGTFSKKAFLTSSKRLSTSVTKNESSSTISLVSDSSLATAKL